MLFSEYLSKILPTFEGSRVKSNLDSVIKEIDTVVPTVRGLTEVWPDKYIFKSSEITLIDDAIKQHYKGKSPARNANSVDIIHAALVNMQTTLPYIKSKVSKLFKGGISTDGLSFTKANVLNFTEAAEYFVRYSRIYLNYMTAAEQAELDSKQITKTIGPDDLEFISINRFTFIACLNVMSIELKELKKGFGSITDMIIDAKSEGAITSTVGKSAIDPFGFSPVPFPLSLIYRVRLNVSEYQITRYEEAVSEAKAIEYRTLILKERIENGQGSAAIEKRLALEEEHLLKLRRKIAKLEEKYGV